MANSALGTKRLCLSCTSKFYDLAKDPIVCPNCDTVFVIPKPAPSRGRGAYSQPQHPVPNQPVAPAHAEDTETVDAEADEVEAKDGDDAEAEGGVPMLEELDEK